MPKFSNRSKERLETCDERLQKVFNEVIKHFDCTILEGHRSNERQEELYRQGKSKIKKGGKHNSLPSKAVDVAPFVKGKGIPWDDSKYFYYFGGYVLGVAQSMGIKLRHGYDWNMNFNLDDQSFFDGPHFELTEDE